MQEKCAIHPEEISQTAISKNLAPAEKYLLLQSCQNENHANTLGMVRRNLKFIALRVVPL